MSVYENWWPSGTLTGALQTAVDQTKEINKQLYLLRLRVRAAPYPLDKEAGAPGVVNPPFLPSFVPPPPDEVLKEGETKKYYYVYYDDSKAVWLYIDKAYVRFHQQRLRMVAAWKDSQQKWYYLDPLKQVTKQSKYRPPESPFYFDLSDSDEEEDGLLDKLKDAGVLDEYHGLRNTLKQVRDEDIPRWNELINDATKTNEAWWSREYDAPFPKFSFAQYTDEMVQTARLGGYWPPFYPRSRASPTYIDWLCKKGEQEWKVVEVKEIGKKKVLVPVPAPTLGTVFEQRAVVMKDFINQLRGCVFAIGQRVNQYEQEEVLLPFEVEPRPMHLMSPTDELELTECLATFLHLTTAMFMPHIYKWKDRLEAWDFESIYMQMLRTHLKSQTYTIGERSSVTGLVRHLMKEARGQDARLPFFQGANANKVLGGTHRANEWPHPYSASLTYTTNEGVQLDLLKRPWPAALNEFLAV